MKPIDITVRLVAAATLLSAMANAATQTYRVDSARSRATIHVGKSGTFSFAAGHTHDASGPIQEGTIDLDVNAPSNSRVHLVIPATQLAVSAEREPEGDAPKVQDAMRGEKVLDVARYPRITYESTSVTLEDRRGDVLDLTLRGRLTIRDTTRDVTAPVHVELNGSALTATGRFAIKQSSFGIKPISIGGLVAVKDALDIEFSVSARK